MTTWDKHETALKELCESNAGNLTVDMVMTYLYEQGMLASQLEPLVMQKPAASGQALKTNYQNQWKMFL